MHTSVPLVRKPDSSGVPTASEALGRRWRDSLVFPRMPANPLVVVSVGERKVADDGVRQIISFTYLHLAAEYGQFGPIQTDSRGVASNFTALGNQVSGVRRDDLFRRVKDGFRQGRRCPAGTVG